MKRGFQNKILSFLFFFLVAGCLNTLLAKDNAADSFQKGEFYFQKGDHFAAIENYKEALEVNPRYFKALYGLSFCYFVLEEYDVALGYADTAIIYNKKNIDILSLRGRILIGLNRPDDALKQFREILKTHPHNDAANLGIAEVYMVKGNSNKAEELLRRNLPHSGEGRRTLLTLALLHDARMDHKGAENYIRMALRNYPEDPQVYYVASNHYLSMNQPEKGKYFIDELAGLKPNDPEVKRMRGLIYILTGDYTNGITFLNDCLKTFRDDYRTIYLLGIAFKETGQLNQAINCFKKLVELNPQDEIAQITLEELIMTFPSEYEGRKTYADNHIREGYKFEKKYFFDKALSQYWRAVVLSPSYINSRLRYARVFKKRGFSGRYLNELKILKESGYKSGKLDKEIIRLQKESRDLIRKKWGVDQFNLTHDKYRIALFYEEGASHLLHFSAEPYLTGYVKSIIERSPDVEVLNIKGRKASSFSEAFRMSREGNADYFAILTFFEMERTFSVKVSVYLSRTGALVKETSFLKSGNRRVVNTFEKGVEDLSNLFPQRGRIVKIDENIGLINNGSIHGIRKDMVFDIVKKGGANLNTTPPYFAIPKGTHLGTFTVTRVDEEASEGTIQRFADFDLLNSGDEIYLRPEKDGEDETVKEDDSNLTNELNQEIKSQLLKIY